MILTQKNLSNAWEQFKWPLNGIRRYGYYKDIFLFESGRKCPHGEGLYAFKCTKAKYLNEALHKAITNNASTLSDESNGNATRRIINTKLSRFVIKEESEQMTHSDSCINAAELNVNAANLLKQSPSHESKSSTQTFTSAPQTPTVSQTMCTALLEDESTSPSHTNSTSQQHNYVNANSLISLPPLISLSFLNAPSTTTMENRDYINAPYFSQLQQRQQQHQAEKQEIDPALLSLALKINGVSSTNSKSSLFRKSLIRSSISTVGTHDQDDESSAYHFNIMPIQQAVSNGAKSRDERKKRPRNSMSMNSISSNASSLNEINYIVPEILKESKLKQVNEEEQAAQVGQSGKSNNEKSQQAEIAHLKQQDQANVTQAVANSPLNESQIEYVTIDPKKTPAIKSSSDLVSKQRNAERIKHLHNDQ